MHKVPQAVQKTQTVNNKTENIIKLNWPYFYSGLAILLLGYTAMAVFKSEFIRISASPVLIMLGFVLLVISILKKRDI